MNDHKQIIQWARETGEGDCEDGLDRIPAQSGALQGLHMQLGRTFGEDTELLAAWLQGWDAARLAAPLPEQDETPDPWDSAAQSAAMCGGSTFRRCRHGNAPSECPTCNREEVYSD